MMYRIHYDVWCVFDRFYACVVYIEASSIFQVAVVYARMYIIMKIPILL